MKDKTVKSFTIRFDINDQSLIDALSRDDNFVISVEQMKINFAYELYLMCNEAERRVVFSKDRCVTANVMINEDVEEGYV